MPFVALGVKPKTKKGRSYIGPTANTIKHFCLDSPITMMGLFSKQKICC